MGGDDVSQRKRAIDMRLQPPFFDKVAHGSQRIDRRLEGLPVIALYSMRSGTAFLLSKL